jgi:hypothetical protein
MASDKHWILRTIIVGENDNDYVSAVTVQKLKALGKNFLLPNADIVTLLADTSRQGKDTKQFCISLLTRNPRKMEDSIEGSRLSAKVS